MKQELSGSISGSVSAHLIDQSPCIVIFVAGEQSCVETAIRSARRLYPDRHFVFVCEPAHRAWISQASSERVLVVEQPFNPFGRTASELRRCLESTPIEACALIIADIGFESFRFRVYALRLRTQHFLLLSGDKLDSSKQLNRFSFALLAGAAPFLGRLSKIEKRILLQLCSTAAWFRNLPDRINRSFKTIQVWLRELQDRIFMTYDSSIGSWLRELQKAYESAAEELSALTEEALTQAVEVQRISGMGRVDSSGCVRRKFNSALGSLGIRYLDKRYRGIFQDLFQQATHLFSGERLGRRLRGLGREDDRHKAHGILLVGASGGNIGPLWTRRSWGRRIDRGEGNYFWGRAGAKSRHERTTLPPRSSSLRKQGPITTGPSY